MARLLAILFAFGLSFSGAFGAAPTEQYPVGQSSPAGGDSARLVRQLGDRSFAVRRNATARLIELGVESIEALERGVQSEDREISFRSRHVLKIVRENDFQRRLRAFATGRDVTERYELPCWALFAKMVGVGPNARTLFVEMQHAESKLLASFDRSPTKIGDVLVQRIADLQAIAARGRESDMPSLGSIASILFVLNNQDVDMPPSNLTHLSQGLGPYFRYPSFSQAIQSGAQRDLLRKMLGRWIEKSQGWDAYHAMFLAMQYDIPVGLVPARRILEGELPEANQAYFLGYAILTFARLGDKSHHAVIEKFLDNTTPYGGSIAVAGKSRYRTQIRDIALATLVHLAGLDFKEFGFSRHRRHSYLVFDTASLAFENDAQRDKAIKKWMDRRADEEDDI